MYSHSLHRISQSLRLPSPRRRPAAAFVLTVLSLFSDPASQITAATEVFASLTITITAVTALS